MRRLMVIITRASYNKLNSGLYACITLRALTTELKYVGAQLNFMFFNFNYNYQVSQLS